MKGKKFWNKITVINPAPAVALQTQRILETLNTSKDNLSQNYFYSTWNETILKSFVERISQELNYTNNSRYEHITI